MKKYLATLILILAVTQAQAGPYGDDLGKCLIDSTSQRDRNTLIIWMFSAAAKHPAVQDILDVSSEKLDSANKNFADLTMRLLTVDCENFARKAIKVEGIPALTGSFKLLGEVAGRELFSSSHVSQALAGFESHLDGERLEALRQ